MTKDALYTLDELAQAAGITPRTIRFYTGEGLLPGPQARGRFALYGPGHLARLRLIALLKAALMPLAQMREHLPGLADAHIAALLNGAGATGSALERLSGEAAFALEPGAVGTPIAEQSAAYRTLSGALTARPSCDVPLSSRQTQPAKAQADKTPPSRTRPDESPSDSRKTRRALLVSSRLLASDRPHNGDIPDAQDVEVRADTSENQPSELFSEIENPDTWQRILLAPGVELHVRTPDSPRGREQLDRAIAHAKSLFQP